MVETENPRSEKERTEKVITVEFSLPWSLLSEFDTLIKGVYGSRSEAIREAMRGLVDQLHRRERHKGLAERGQEKN